MIIFYIVIIDTYEIYGDQNLLAYILPNKNSILPPGQLAGVDCGKKR